MYINNYIIWQNSKIIQNGQSYPEIATEGATARVLDVYHQWGFNYPKFFKMDILSRTAFLCAEILAPYPIALDKNKVATVISSYSGCIQIDKQFEESKKTIPSPAMFVYTLPNIMLGEICIRHGFKGEQICTISENTALPLLQFQVEDLLRNRGMDACLCGHVEATDNNIDATLLWVSKVQTSKDAPSFTTENLRKIFIK